MDILSIYISFANLFIFTLFFFILDKSYLKGKINYFIILIILICGLYIGKYYDNLDCLFLLIAFYILSIKNSPHKNIADTLVVVSSSYILSRVFIKCTKLLFYIDFESRHYILLIILFLITFLYIAVVSMIIEKWLFPKIRQTKSEEIIACILVTYILIYQAYWLLNHANLLRGFILIFFIVLLVFIVSIIQIFAKNEELNYQAKERQLEYDLMIKHIEEVKKQYQEMRQFRHDYINILSTIEYYLAQEDMTELKSFYQSSIKPTKRLFQTNMLRLDELQKIESVENGLVGRNGSGKSLLFKTIVGFMPLQEGQIQIDGKELGKKKFLQDAGVIIESPNFINNLTGFDNLKLLAQIKNTIDVERIKEVLLQVGLSADLNQKYKNYSLGMKQRLRIAQAIMEDPTYYILDEPFNGLDEQGVKDMHLLINQLKTSDKTILLTSHDERDIESLCDAVFKIEGGKVLER